MSALGAEWGRAPRCSAVMDTCLEILLQRGGVSVVLFTTLLLRVVNAARFVCCAIA